MPEIQSRLELLRAKYEEASRAKSHIESQNLYNCWYDDSQSQVVEAKVTQAKKELDSHLMVIYPSEDKR